MSANKINTIIPELRFSEFSGEWKKVSIREIAKKIGSGSTPSGGNKVYLLKGILFIRSQKVTNGKLDLTDIAYIPENIHKKMKIHIIIIHFIYKWIYFKG